MRTWGRRGRSRWPVDPCERNVGLHGQDLGAGQRGLADCERVDHRVFRPADHLGQRPPRPQLGHLPHRSERPGLPVRPQSQLIASHTVSGNLPIDPAVAAQPGCMSPARSATPPTAWRSSTASMPGSATRSRTRSRNLRRPSRDLRHLPLPLRLGLPPRATNPTSTLIGYALDGFGIYNRYDTSGAELTNNDLDVCHGRTSPVMWNGSIQNVYHYVVTRAFPYTISCYKGTRGA